MSTTTKVTKIINIKKFAYQNNNFVALCFAYAGLVIAMLSIIIGVIYAFINAYPDVANDGTGANWAFLWDHYFSYFGVQVSFIALAFFILFFLNKIFVVIQTGSFQDALASFSIMTIILYFAFNFKDNYNGIFNDGDEINNLPAFWAATVLTNVILPLTILGFYAAQLMGKRTYAYNKSLNHFSFTMLYPIAYVLLIALFPFFHDQPIYGPNTDASEKVASFGFLVLIAVGFICSTICVYMLDELVHPYNEKENKVRNI